MVISTIREYRDGFIIVINENNVRYRSIQSDVMAIALHVAEAMIKEIIYIEDKKIDKDRLDSELSKFYEFITSNCSVVICFQCKDIKMIDHDIKCIFIHIPRTAGSSISTALTQRKKEGERFENRAKQKQDKIHFGSHRTSTKKVWIGCLERISNICVC